MASRTSARSKKLTAPVVQPGPVNVRPSSFVAKREPDVGDYLGRRVVHELLQEVTVQLEHTRGLLWRAANRYQDGINAKEWALLEREYIKLGGCQQQISRVRDRTQ